MHFEQMLRESIKNEEHEIFTRFFSAVDKSCYKNVRVQMKSESKSRWNLIINSVSENMIEI